MPTPFDAPHAREAGDESWLDRTVILEGWTSVPYPFSWKDPQATRLKDGFFEAIRRSQADGVHGVYGVRSARYQSEMVMPDVRCDVWLASPDMLQEFCRGLHGPHRLGVVNISP